MSTPSPRSRAARERAARRWHVYLILCRSGTIYTGIALDVAARYAQHLAGTGARCTRANPPRRLLAKFACPNQSVAARLEAAIKNLRAVDKKNLVGKSGAEARKALLGWPTPTRAREARRAKMPARDSGGCRAARLVRGASAPGVGRHTTLCVN